VKYIEERGNPCFRGPNNSKAWFYYTEFVKLGLFDEQYKFL
jgi:hypothetical protein